MKGRERKRERESEERWCQWMFMMDTPCATSGHSSQRSWNFYDGDDGFNGGRTNSSDSSSRSHFATCGSQSFARRPGTGSAFQHGGRRLIKWWILVLRESRPPNKCAILRPNRDSFCPFSGSSCRRLTSRGPNASLSRPGLAGRTRLVWRVPSRPLFALSLLGWIGDREKESIHTGWLAQYNASHVISFVYIARITITLSWKEVNWVESLINLFIEMAENQETPLQGVAVISCFEAQPDELLKSKCHRTDMKPFFSDV